MILLECPARFQYSVCGLRTLKLWSDSVCGLQPSSRDQTQSVALKLRSDSVCGPQVVIRLSLRPAIIKSWSDSVCGLRSSSRDPTQSAAYLWPFLWSLSRRVRTEKWSFRVLAMLSKLIWGFGWSGLNVAVKSEAELIFHPPDHNFCCYTLSHTSNNNRLE